MRYKYLDHTADAKFEAYGKTLEEAFENSAFATINMITDTDKVKPVHKHTIKLESPKLTHLLYDFVDEILYLMDTKGWFISKFENTKITQGSINIIETTAYFDEEKHYEHSGNVKSPTMNDIEIKKVDEQYKITMVVDI